MTEGPLRNIITQDIFYQLGSFQSLSVGIHLDKFKVFKDLKFTNENH